MEIQCLFLVRPARLHGSCDFVEFRHIFRVFGVVLTVVETVVYLNGVIKRIERHRRVERYYAHVVTTQDIVIYIEECIGVLVCHIQSLRFVVDARLVSSDSKVGCLCRLCTLLSRERSDLSYKRKVRYILRVSCPCSRRHKRELHSSKTQCDCCRSHFFQTICLFHNFHPFSSVSPIQHFYHIFFTIQMPDCIIPQLCINRQLAYCINIIWCIWSISQIIGFFEPFLPRRY